MKTTVIGAFPKISDDPGGQELRRALHRYDRGELDQTELDAVFDEITRFAIQQMERAGVDVINDGQIRWDDLLSPLADAWKTTERGPLERFYDNNTYFRQPIITGPLSSDGEVLAAPYRRAKEVARRELKAAICGPLTFATLTAEDSAHRDLEARVLAVATALAHEIRALGRAGAPLVDVEDPAVVARPDLIELARRAYDLLASEAGVDIALITYFFPADPVLAGLAAFPVAQIGLDLRSRETRVLERIGELAGKTVVLGAVDARNTRLEAADDVARIAEAAARALGPERVWLAPTTGLEYLPHDVAMRKLAVLVEGARDAGAVPA